MKKYKDNDTLTKLIKIIKISIILLLGIIYLHGVFSKPLKDLQFVFKAGEIYFETSCEFYEDELESSQ